MRPKFAGHETNTVIILSNFSFSKPIGHFGKYHSTVCLSPQILHKLSFFFFLGPLEVPREIENNAYAKVGGQTKSIMVFSRVAYRRIFVYTFCLINICLSLSDDANKIKTLNIERA